MAAGTAALDVSAREIVRDALVLGRGFFGAVRLADLRDMPIDEYFELMEEVNRLAEKTEEPDAS